MAQTLASPYSQFFDGNGNPLAGGKIYTYAAGTTTPLASYTDSTGTVAASNPIILDSAGRAAIWLAGNYKIVVKSSADVTIWTTDNITAASATGDMLKSVYDGANIIEQVVGLTAVQTLTNKTLTAATLGGTTNVSGGQLAFPATQVPSSDANTLDDYEEGTWTVSATCGTSGTITLDGAVDRGSYTKIGNLVCVRGYIEVTSVSSPTGTIRISLPFTIGDTPEYGGRSAAFVILNNTVSANAGVNAGVLEEGTAYIECFNYSATALTSTLAAQAQTGTGIYFQATYTV